MSERKPRSKPHRATASTITPEQFAQLFDPPFLLDGEDPKAYEQLRLQICAAVNPVDGMEAI